MRAALLLLLSACAERAARAAPAADLVSGIPGFPGAAPFKTYAGYLQVPGPIAGYSSLKIAYIFNEAIVPNPTDEVSSLPPMSHPPSLFQPMPCQRTTL
jgi:hypothetical protein